MSASLGCVTVRLANGKSRATPELVRLINENVNPPTPIVVDDVYIRAMYIVSNKTNNFGGRFPVEEHDRLIELLIDSPVIVGHKLPIARQFYAVLTDCDGQQMVKSYFYWLKVAEGACNLQENIDYRIYKEGSLGFTFLFPKCSICKLDIRQCEHEPLAEYNVNGKLMVCNFSYHQLERILETSLVVYRFEETK